MENWQRNIQVVNAGGGSPQARDHSDCRICNEHNDLEEQEEKVYNRSMDSKSLLSVGRTKKVVRQTKSIGGL